jgi:hypothetical protein
MSSLDCENSCALSRRRALLNMLALLAAAVMLPQQASAQVVTPPSGSSLRKQILDALRPIVAKEIGGAIEFAVSDLRVLYDWAYVSARPQRPGGAPIDWLATKYAQAWKEDTMSDLVPALVHQEAGSWHVKECAIGPTDVIWQGWTTQYTLPRILFIDR